MNVSHTVYPPTVLSENEWMKEFNVSGLYPDRGGITRAREMMEQWQEHKQESIWKELVNRVKIC